MSEERAIHLHLEGEEIAATMVEAIHADCLRLGRAPTQEDLTDGVGALLSVAWALAKKLDPEGAAGARVRFGQLLYAFADNAATSGE